MPINSRSKGSRGERAWRDELVRHGYSARRGQQFSGSPDSPDVICPDLPFHFEVKHVQALNVHDGMAQAIKDSARPACETGLAPTGLGVDRTPVLAHKKNRMGWLVTMRSEDWFFLVKQARSAKPVIDFSPDQDHFAVNISSHKQALVGQAPVGLVSQVPLAPPTTKE